MTNEDMYNEKKNKNIRLMNLDEYVRYAIKAIRLRTGLTQTEFGRRLGGIPLRTVQNWERGVSECPLYVLDLIRYRVDHDERIPKKRGE